MRKLLLSCCALLMVSQIHAQTPLANAGLETWTSLFLESQQPSGWLTPNLLTSTLIEEPNTNPVSVTKETGAGDFTEGTASMKIKTVTLNTNPYPDFIPMTGGIAFIGVPVPDGSEIKLKIGYPVSDFAPISFTYDQKYIPVNIDTAFCNVILTRFNSVANKRDTIAFALDTITGTASTFSSRLMELFYKPEFAGENADTCMIAYSSSSRHLPVEGSVLFVDNLAFAFPTGTKSGIAEDGFMIYPNPANGRLNISGISGNHNASRADVYSADGLLVASEEINAASSSVSTAHLKAGMYHLQISNKNGQIVSRKKFSVVR